MLIIYYFSSKNDCNEKAPFIGYFITYIAWSMVAYIALFIFLICVYLSFPKIDNWIVEAQPTTDETSPLLNAQPAETGDNTMEINREEAKP
jgi:hypothetical protein